MHLDNAQLTSTYPAGLECVYGKCGLNNFVFFEKIQQSATTPHTTHHYHTTTQHTTPHTNLNHYTPPPNSHQNTSMHVLKVR